MPWQRPSDRATNLRDGLLIPALPESLRWCPTEPDRYEAWWNAVYRYRQEIRRIADGSPQAQRHLQKATSNDYNYFLCIFGVIKEPRSRAGLAPGFRPFIPLPFQVELGHVLRYIATLNNDSAGGETQLAAHLLIEKARDMGVTWYCVGNAAHGWLHKTGYKAGFSSYSADLVDIRGDDDAMFTKARSILGIEPGIPEDLVLPDYMKPMGFHPHFNDKERLLKNPQNGNEIKGYTTTKDIARGGRSTEMYNDEAASNRYYREAKSAQQNTTDHIIDISSAAMKDGGSFRDQCKEAREDQQAGRPGQTYIRLDWWLNPRHDERWYWSQKEKMDKTDKTAFAREVLIDYTAGQSDWVYGFMQDVEVTDAPYDPAGGQLYCTIDPGLRDPAYVIYVQHMPALEPARRWRVVHAYQCENKSARFLASVLVGRPITGPNGWGMTDYASAMPTMDFVNSLNRTIIYTGDIYGTHRGGDGEMTYYERLLHTSDELTHGRHAIAVTVRTDNESRSYQKRMQALTEVLKQMEWHNSPSVAYTLRAVKEARFGDGPDPQKPLHDWTSHPRSALEHWAVVVEGTDGAHWSKQPEPQLVDLGGTPLGDNPYMLPPDLLYRPDMAPAAPMNGMAGMYPGDYSIADPSGNPMRRLV